MKLYLDRSLEDIPLFKNLIILLRGILSNKQYQSEYLTPEDIYKISHLYDPVRDFFEYYIGIVTADSDDKDYKNLLYPEGRLQYMINAMYASKGAIKVFETLEELTEIPITYKYNFPVIELMQFKDITIDNVDIFVNKLTNMLYYLLYYTDIIIKIIDLTLKINAKLAEYKYKKVLPYQVFKFEK